MAQLFSSVHGPQRAVLVARTAADIGDVSRTGCRFLVSKPLPVGSIGMLSVTIAGQPHTELFRVSRTEAIPDDASLYEVGVEFLPVPAEQASLQDLVVRLERTHSIG